MMIGIFNQPGGRLITDWSHRAQGGVITTNERGYESFDCFVPMSLEDSFRFYDSPLQHLVVSAGAGERPFEGRLEDRAIVPGGIQATALGYQRAYSDVPYTAAWSDKHYARWREMTGDDVALRTPQQYEIDNNNRLYVAPRAGETFANNQDVAEMTYAAPHLGSRNIVAFSCSYSLLLPANWLFRVVTRNYDFSGQAVINTVTATGGSQSGTLNLTFTGAPRVCIQVLNSSGGGSTIGGDTGDNFVKLTNVRVKTTTSATVLASAIIANLVSFVAGTNPTQAQAATAINVETASLDLEDAIYEDVYPADVLNSLIDQAVDGQRWQWSVWENRYLKFHRRGAYARTWYTDAASLDVSSTVDNLINSAYGTYRNGFGETERTATTASAESIAAYGLTRRGVASERSSSQAEKRRDLLLSERKDLTPRARLELSGLYNAAGASFPLWMCRAGDILVVRNLPAVYSPAVDKIRKFYIASTSYDMESDTLTPSPDFDIPGLDIMVANMARRSSYQVTPVLIGDVPNIPLGDAGAEIG